jgi:hypothetical protein
MATNERTPEVEPTAAPCAGQDLELKNSMQSLRTTRVNPAPPSTASKPTKKAEAKKGKTHSVKQAKPTGPDDIDEVLSEIDLTGQLSIKEVRFIGLRFAGSLTTDRAMIAAGYGSYSQKQRYRIATKIVQKYESQAGDHQ